MRLIPPYIDTASSAAEKKVFKKLQEEANTQDTREWYCFHSLGIARHSRKREGEADFVFLSPQGILVLEVKGGRVSRKDGTWYFTDRYGRTTEKKESPFSQARTAVYSIRDDLKNKFGHKILSYTSGYGVVFTDIPFGETSPEWDKKIIFDSTRMEEDFTRYLLGLASYWKSRASSYETIGSSELKEMANYLRGDFEKIKPLTDQIEVSERELITLTEAQYRALDALASNKRVIFTGSAGTGKTMLAVEKARRSGHEGRKTLLLCYSRLLSSHIRSIIRNEGLQEVIYASSVHAFMSEKIKESGLGSELQRASTKENPSRLYREVFPELFLKASEGRNPDFSELILDEAQDVMTPEYMAALDQSFTGGFSGGLWSLFLDLENQKGMYADFDTSTFDELCSHGSVYNLGLNCRNTKPIAIHAEVISGFPMAPVRTADGIPVTYLWFSDQAEEAESVGNAINLLLKEGMEPSAISVLSTKSDRLSVAGGGKLKIDAPLISLSAMQSSPSEAKAVTYCSIQAFKGLENKVVFLTDIEEMDSDWMKTVNYVGFTRARSGLWVALHSKLKGGLQDSFSKIGTM